MPPSLGWAPCSADLTAVGTDGAGRDDHRSDLVKNAVEAGEAAGRADDRGGGVDDERGVVRSVEVEGHGAGHTVYRPGEGLDVVEVGAPVGMDDQDAVQGRGTAERARVGRRRT